MHPLLAADAAAAGGGRGGGGGGGGEQPNGSGGLNLRCPSIIRGELLGAQTARVHFCHVLGFLSGPGIFSDVWVLHKPGSTVRYFAFFFCKESREYAVLGRRLSRSSQQVDLHVEMTFS